MVALASAGSFEYIQIVKTTALVSGCLTGLPMKMVLHSEM